MKKLSEWGGMAAWQVLPLGALAPAFEEIAPAAVISLPDALVFSNRVAADGAPQRLLGARVGRPAAIRLHRLPPGAEVFCTAQYIAVVSDALMADQLQPQHQKDPAAVLHGFDTTPPVQVPGEMLLVARFGMGIWGHWIGELLPKIVLAEQHFPRRFTFVLPRTAFIEGKVFGMRARESLAQYGITMERVFLTGYQRRYRFTALHAISPVWSDFMPHPAARAALRQISVSETTHGTRVALLRDDTPRRQIANREEVLAVLRARGFAVLNPAELPFAEQVAVMRGASDVFAILGSGLAGLMYARPGVRVVSVAPDCFVDRFFYALMQMADARYIDLVGPVVTRDARFARDSCFSVPLDILQGL